MLFKEVLDSIAKIESPTISNERKEILLDLIDYIQDNYDKKKPINLNFICTHNSRRSHLSQVWAQALSTFFRIPNVYCYSGGTATTAMYSKTVETLKSQGFQISTLAENKNPIYQIKLGEDIAPVIGFSKTYDDSFNPKANFAAIMTCSSADENCPFIPGAKRFSLTYEDPKDFDGSPLQTEKYLERSIEIATELYFVFLQIKK